MKRILLLSLILFSLANQAAISTAKPWVFFDLGNTLIDAKNMKNLTYLFEANRYIKELKRKGLKIGMVTNIPEEWGQTNAQKIAKLKSFINSNWKDSSPFAWELFDKIFVPPKDAKRKPDPFLFTQSVTFSSPCSSLFVGEDKREIIAARKAGMATYLVGSLEPHFFLPADQVVSQLKKMKNDPNCFL